MTRADTDPRDLPALRKDFVPVLEGRSRRPVIMVDANVLVKDAVAIAKGTDVEKVALAELCQAAGVRVVMSERDVRRNEQGVSRIEAAIQKRVADSGLPPTLASRAIAVWREEFLPYMTVLSPAGLRHTERSSQVLAPSRDADDADLGLLGDVLDADAFASYDRKAFHGLYPVLLEKERGHAQLFLAYRDARRFEETSQAMMAVPALALWGTWEAGKGIVRTLKIPPNAAVVGVGLLLTAALMYSPSRKWMGGQVAGYFDMLARTLPSPERAAQIAVAKARSSVEWEEASSVVVAAARVLIRSKDSMTTTELSRELRFREGPSGLAPLLRQSPGLFLEERWGRWVIPQGPAKSY